MTNHTGIAEVCPDMGWDDRELCVARFEHMLGKGCYFLVFVQLFEKYGTLIERYTALIEKVSALIAGDSSDFCDEGYSGGDVWWEGNSCPGDDICEKHDTNPYYDILSHDRIDSSFMIVLQLVTVTSWQEVMYIQQETSGEMVSADIRSFLRGDRVGC
eukprot:SAG31_NODE_5257_length_2647_cov_1.852433_3_plen_158_part_00